MTPGELPAGLVAAGIAGPYFRVEPWTPVAGWRPYADLLHGAFDERVADARAVLASAAGVPVGRVTPRVAASTVFLGLAARLIAPTMGSVTLAGVLPELTVADVHWAPAPRGPWPLALRPVGERLVGRLPPAAQAAALYEQVVTGLLDPLLDVVAGRYRLSRRVLWGNVASAAAGAAAMLSGHGPAGPLLAALLDTGGLRGTGTLEQPDPGRDRRFLVRASCCLYYRVPGGGTCSDCVLTAPAQRAAHQRRMLAAT